MCTLNSRPMRCIIMLVLSHVKLRIRGCLDGCAQFLVGRGPRLIVSYSVTRVPPDEMNSLQTSKVIQKFGSQYSVFRQQLLKGSLSVRPKAKFRHKYEYSVLCTLYVIIRSTPNVILRAFR